MNTDKTGQNKGICLQSGSIQERQDGLILFPQEIDALIHQQRQKIVADNDIQQISFFLPERQIERDYLFPKDVFRKIRSQPQHAGMEFAADEWNYDAPKIQMLREGKREARVLTREEQKSLTEALLDDMDICKFGILLALYTGIRVGELCALQWEDVSEDCIYVNKTMQRLWRREDGKTDVVVGPPKSSSSRRRIPLPGFLQPYVVHFRMPGGYVIRTQRRDHSEPRSMQFKFSQIADRCGLKDVTFHTLRHTFATRCIESGFDVKTLSEILGHTDVKTTLNRYVHSSFELKRENMEKLPFLQG